MLGTLLTIVHVFICIFLICIVLLQQGKGADVGATFGGGGNTMFGSGGADNFLTKVTTFIAVCFMLTSLALTVRSQDGTDTSGALFQSLPDRAPVTGTEVPAAAPATAPSEASNEAAAPTQEAAPTEATEAPAAEPKSESQNTEAAPQEAAQ